MVVSNYYLISAGPDDKSAGRVRMISPDKKTDFTDEGYVGGTRITLKADPNPGYEISKWVVDDCGTRKTYPGEETFTFTVRSQNTVGDGKVKITSVMKTKNNRLKIGQKGEGKVSVSPEIVNGDNVLAGTKLKFKAEPEEGWRFEEWRFTSLGGDNIVSEGVTDEEGNSTKEFTMPDSSAEVHALFARNTVDVLAAEGLEVLFVNNGGDPYHEKGEVVATERGKNVPRGAEVIVRTKKGTVLAPNADFKVSVTDSEGIVQIVPVPIMSQGRDACTFKLPDDAESCIVSAETAKGVFVVYAEGDGVDFQISVDGTVKDGKEVEGIVSGSQVDIKATPKVRGKRISGWIINGEEKKTYDPIYTFNIVENMDIVAVMEPVSDYDMKISTEGGGTLEYIVSDPEGKEYDPVYVQPTGIDYKADVYQDESILFKASDKEADYTLTSLEVNGENKELDEGTFKVTQVDGDLDVKATFSPNVYFQVEMDTKFRDKRSLVLDDSYGEISNGEIIPAAKNRDFTFSVVVPDDSDIYVWAADPAKDPSEYDGNDSILPKSRKVYKDDLWIYYYKVENIQSDVRIVVSDHYTFYIRTPKQFEEYIRRAKGGSSQGKQTDGVLMNDIDMQDIDIGQLDNDMRLRDMYASFDGNGHTIQNLRLSAKAAERGFWGLFGTIHEGAEVRDVVFSNATLDGSYNCGLLADKNYGTISGVSIIGSSITVKEDCVRAGIAYENLGTIENCMIRDLTFNASGNTVAGGVVYNGPAPGSGESSDASNASMTGCSWW